MGAAPGTFASLMPALAPSIAPSVAGTAAAGSIGGALAGGGAGLLGAAAPGSFAGLMPALAPGVAPSAAGTAAAGSIGGAWPTIAGGAGLSGAASQVGQAAADGGRGGIRSGLADFGKEALSKIVSPQGITGIAGLLAALMGKDKANPANNPQVQQQMDLALERQRMENERYKRMDPLHESVTRLAYSMLPISARNK